MQIKGPVLHARMDYVKEHFGEDAWSRVLESMSDEDCQILGDVIVTVNWYPFDVRGGNVLCRRLSDDRGMVQGGAEDVRRQERPGRR